MDYSLRRGQSSRPGGLTSGPAPIRPRPASMVLSSPSLSHAPGSIYPDIPLQNSHLRTNTPSRVDPSRRHTMYLPSSPRREPRPLRSSPLAGPSIVEDGSLTGSDESGSSRTHEPRPRYRPNRISSSPDVADVFSRPTSMYGPPSASSSTRPTSLPPDINETNGTQTELPSPTEPEPIKRSRRLSWGFVKLAPLPSLPSRSASTRSSKKPPQLRSQGPPPPVPEIPVWALPSSTRSSSSPTAQHSDLSSSLPASARRPSTSPGGKNPNRQSMYVGHSTGPSTSRDPELNWLSSAAPPKFSRLSLKAEGVVLPISAKDAQKIAKRRSTATISGSSPPSNIVGGEPKIDNAKGREQETRLPSRMPSKASLVSLQSEASSTVPLPAPPFSAGSRNNSLSSLGSTSSMIAPTPSLSLSRTSSVGSTTDVDEMGVLSGVERALGSSTSDGGFQKAVVGVEVRLNDVCVDVIATSDAKPGKSQAIPSASVVAPEPSPDICGAQPTITGRLQRGKGTIKRIWKRVVGTVRH